MLVQLGVGTEGAVPAGPRGRMQQSIWKMLAVQLGRSAECRDALVGHGAAGGGRSQACSLERG